MLFIGTVMARSRRTFTGSSQKVRLRLHNTGPQQKQFLTGIISGFLTRNPNESQQEAVENKEIFLQALRAFGEILVI